MSTFIIWYSTRIFQFKYLPIFVTPYPRPSQPYFPAYRMPYPYRMGPVFIPVLNPEIRSEIRLYVENYVFFSSTSNARCSHWLQLAHSYYLYSILGGFHFKKSSISAFLRPSVLRQRLALANNTGSNTALPPFRIPYRLIRVRVHPVIRYGSLSLIRAKEKWRKCAIQRAAPPVLKYGAEHGGVLRQKRTVLTLSYRNPYRRRTVRFATRHACRTAGQTENIGMSWTLQRQTTLQTMPLYRYDP